MNENITKEGIEVQIGQKWRDLDKRCPNRIIEVRAVANGRAYFGASLNRKIRINRMHRHSTGFELVA